MVKVIGIAGDKKTISDSFTILTGAMVLESEGEFKETVTHYYISEIDEKFHVKKMIYFGEVFPHSILPNATDRIIELITSFIEKNRTRILSGGVGINADIRLQMREMQRSVFIN
jgi:hypothetical protein